MQHRDKAILNKIVSELDYGINLLSNMSCDRFLDDELYKRAASMTTINIGELVKTLTDEIRNKHNHVPWRGMAGMRDIAAHRYQTLRMEDVYNTISDEFPVLRKKIVLILAEDITE